MTREDLLGDKGGIEKVSTAGALGMEPWNQGFTGESSSRRMAPMRTDSTDGAT